MIFSDLMNIENIYLMKIEEPEDNFLRLTFITTKTSEKPENFYINDKTIKNIHSIDYDNSKPYIQIDFDTYIGYSILNESYTSLDEYEIYEGKAFRIFKKSRYLDYINIGTFASDIYPGPFKHYQIACLNHIIDVVSVDEPSIKEIENV